MLRFIFFCTVFVICNISLLLTVLFSGLFSLFLSLPPSLSSLSLSLSLFLFFFCIFFSLFLKSVYIAIAIEDKPRLTKNDYFVIISMHLCILFGFVMNLIVDFEVGICLFILSCLCVTGETWPFNHFFCLIDVTSFFTIYVIFS